MGITCVLDKEDRKYFMFGNEPTLFCVRELDDDEWEAMEGEPVQFVNYSEKGFVFDEEKKLVIYNGDDEYMKNFYNN